MGKRRISHKFENGVEYKWCRYDNHWVELSSFYKNKRTVDGHESKCKFCVKRWKNENPEKVKETRKKSYWKNPEKNRKYTANWIANNKDRVREYRHQYYKDNKEYIAEMCKDWNRKNEMNKYYSNTNYRLTKVLRSTLRRAISRKWKTGRTLELLGCSIDELKIYLESKFDNNMTWDNYGSYWHIDHKRPCASFDLSVPAHQQQCFHYTNLQPLEAVENMKKGARF